MSDAAHRAALEAAQSETVALKKTLAARPAEPPGKAELEARVAALKVQVPQWEDKLAALAQREIAARNALDASGRSQSPVKWWQSAWTPLAVIGGVAASIKLAWWSLDYINWPYWSQRLGIALVATPASVNMLRLVLLGVRDARRRFREGRS